MSYLRYIKKKTEVNEHSGIILTRQQDLLTEIKSVSNSWSRADNIVKTQCTNLFGKSAPCNTELFTDGLVGFLSNKECKKIDNLWCDEYFYANATVEEGARVADGFMFDKPGARAVWQVSKKQKKDLPYNFAVFGFTLVATVKFDNPQEMDQKRSVLGVALDESTERVGVWCSKNKVFALSENGKELAEETPKKECVVGREYYVALVYNNSRMSVYVDWERLGNAKNFEMDNDAQKNLQFYFGVATKGSNVESHVTIKNVLLYNRPFTDKEIEMPKINNKNNVPPLPKGDVSDAVQNTDDDDSNPLDSEISQENAASPSETLTTETNTQPNEDVVQSSSHQKESAVCVNLGVLYLLFGVFVLVGHYV